MQQGFPATRDLRSIESILLEGILKQPIEHARPIRAFLDGEEVLEAAYDALALAENAKEFSFDKALDVLILDKENAKIGLFAIYMECEDATIITPHIQGLPYLASLGTYRGEGFTRFNKALFLRLMPHRIIDDNTTRVKRFMEMNFAPNNGTGLFYEDPLNNIAIGTNFFDSQLEFRGESHLCKEVAQKLQGIKAYEVPREQGSHVVRYREDTIDFVVDKLREVIR